MLSTEICAAVGLAKAGAVVVSRTLKAAVAMAAAGLNEDDFDCGFVFGACFGWNAATRSIATKAKTTTTRDCGIFILIAQYSSFQLAS